MVLSFASVRAETRETVGNEKKSSHAANTQPAPHWIQIAPAPQSGIPWLNPTAPALRTQYKPCWLATLVIQHVFAL